MHGAQTESTDRVTQWSPVLRPELAVYLVELFTDPWFRFRVCVYSVIPCDVVFTPDSVIDSVDASVER